MLLSVNCLSLLRVHLVFVLSYVKMLLDVKYLSLLRLCLVFVLLLVMLSLLLKGLLLLGVHFIFIMLSLSFNCISSSLSSECIFEQYQPKFVSPLVPPRFGIRWSYESREIKIAYAYLYCYKWIKICEILYVTQSTLLLFD